MKTIKQSSAILQTHVTKLCRPLKIAGGHFGSVGEFRGGAHIHFSVIVWFDRKRYRVHASSGEGFNSNSRVLTSNGDTGYRFSIAGATHLRLIGAVRIVPAHVIAYQKSVASHDILGDEDDDPDEGKYGEIVLLTNTRVQLMRNKRNIAQKMRDEEEEY